MEWLTFIVGDEFLALEARYVYRVIDNAKIIPVPLSPASHLGLIYYRGELFNVLYLALLLHQGETRLPVSYRIILLKWSGKRLALVPDQIGELLWMEDKDRAVAVSPLEDHPIQLITPQYVWKKLLEQLDGFRQV